MKEQAGRNETEAERMRSGAASAKIAGRKMHCTEFNVRRMTSRDTEAVSRLEAQIFSQPWSEQGFLDALAREDVIFLVAESEGRTLGYCGMYCALDEGEITNVAVDADFRGQGVGRRLMEVLLKEAQDDGIHTVILEVRVSNEAAIHLYQQLGFEIQGVRKGFYEKPKEDGYVMTVQQ